jgi:PhnB protein
MNATAYLNFNGNCETAFKFYEKVLRAKIIMMMTMGESPMCDQMGPGSEKLIMHARMNIGNSMLMGSDSPPDQYLKPQGSQVALGLNDPAEAERIFKELSENATIVMPIQETFWASRFGMLVDQFGIPWMVNCEPVAK